jgi:uncharacterized protein with FMN-binding domain
MRERAAATAAALTLAAALLIGFKAPDAKALVTAIKTGSGGTTTGAGTTRGGTGTTTGSSTTGGSTTGGSTTGGNANGGSSSGNSTASGTFTGPVAANPYGDVQVQITVKNGKITDVQALAMPTGGHSGRISNYVAPILRSQALSAQSANINGVSGASYTSMAYAESLQGALDAAGL